MPSNSLPPITEPVDLYRVPLVPIWTHGGAVSYGTSYKPEGRGFDFRWCHLNFHWRDPSGHTMTLRSTQPVTEIRTRTISCVVKGRRCIWLTTVPPLCADCLQIWKSQSPGTIKISTGLHKGCFSFTFTGPNFFITCFFHLRLGLTYFQVNFAFPCMLHFKSVSSV
jgi:hypothetical protein